MSQLEGQPSLTSVVTNLDERPSHTNTISCLEDQAALVDVVAYLKEQPTLVDAIADLMEKVDDLQVKRVQDKEDIEEKLEQWSSINLALMECLQKQAQDAKDLITHQQELAKHLLTLGVSTKSLGVSSEKLENSLVNLTKYLEREQAVQLKALETSTTNLTSYLKGEQAKRLKVTEKGMIRLIDIMEQIPGTESLRTRTKGWNFKLFQSPFDVVISSLCTVALLSMLWQLGGGGRELARVEERSVWAILKLERIEAALGINPE